MALSKCSAEQGSQSTILTLGSAYLILAEFMEGNKIRSRSFDLSVDNMRTNDLKEPDEKSVCQREKVLYQRAFSDSRDFTDARAADYMEKNFVFQALGKVGFVEDFRTIVRMVEQQGQSHSTFSMSVGKLTRSQPMRTLPDFLPRSTTMY